MKYSSRALLLLVIYLTLCLTESTRNRKENISRQQQVSVGKDRDGGPTYVPSGNLCKVEGNAAAIHCFCDSEIVNNATKAKCWIFNNLSPEHKIWNTFPSQSNINEMSMLIRPDGHFKTIPTSGLQYLSRLGEFEIKYAAISVVHSYAFANLSSLAEVTLSKNKIEVLKEYAFAHLHNLSVLKLDENKITELNKNVFVDLPNLQKLYLAQNNITLIQNGSFKYLGALQELELDHNQLTVVSRDTFAGLGALRRLDLSRNKLTQLKALTFVELWMLEELMLDNNELTAIAERAFDGLTQLKKLCLSKNKLNLLSGGLLDGVLAVHHLDLRSNQLETLTFNNIRPIIENFYNENSFLGIERNKFVCDCRISWMHRLRNKTKNNKIRNTLEDLTCFMKFLEIPKLQSSVDNQATYPKLKPPEFNPFFDNYDMNPGVSYDETYEEDVNENVLTEAKDPVMKHVMEIPTETLPCPRIVKRPTRIPTQGLSIPEFQEGADILMNDCGFKCYPDFWLTFSVIFFRIYCKINFY